MFGGGHGNQVICGSPDAILKSAIQHYEAGQALDPRQRLIYVAVSILLILIAGICAGLTLGLLSFSPLDLELIQRTAVSNKERLLALKVERVTRNPHQLLVCLLVVNAGCMEMLPLLLDRLLNPFAAILISVSAILIFGEVVPQAVCKKYGLQIGGSLAWLVDIMLFITWPISYPIGKLLDWSLGGSHGKAFFRRAELKEFVTLHGEAPEEEGAAESVLTTEECTVIHGALDLTSKTAESAMTPLDKVFQISADASFDRNVLKQIIEAGHSRVPVYEESSRSILGLILVKELLMYEPDGSLKIKDLQNIREIDFIVADTPLYSVMQLFQVKRRHMAVVIRGGLGYRNTMFSIAGGGGSGSSGGVVREFQGRLGRIGEDNEEEEGDTDTFVSGSSGSLTGVIELPIELTSTGTRSTGRGAGPGEVIGIITAEDVLEELLQTEWQDETDRYLDNRFEERVAPTPRNSDLPPGLLRYVVAERQMRERRAQSGGGGGGRLVLGSSASAPALVSSTSSGTVRRHTRAHPQQQHHLAGSPPVHFSKGSNGGGGGSDDDDENENAPLLDV